MKKNQLEINAVRNASILTKSGVEICDIICKEGIISDVAKSSDGKKGLAARPDFDAKNRIIVPGLIDCHVHLFGVALSEITVDLYGCRSIHEMQRRITRQTQKQSKMKGDRWLIGRGWDQDRFEEKRYPTREDIDTVSESRPALMVRVCGHVGVINSAGIRKIKELTEFPSELVPRSGEDKIAGLVKEEALDCVWEKIPPPPLKLLTDLFVRAQQKALSFGLIGVNCILSENWRIELEAIKSLDRACLLRLKTSLFLPIAALSLVEKMKPEARKEQLNGRNFATIGFKLFTDGSLGARTAALVRPYSDELRTSGVLYYKTAFVTNVARRVKRLGMFLAAHAIGDRAVKQVVDAYRDAGITRSDGFRIEHASVLDRELLLRLDDVIVSVQPSFIASDYWLADRLGEDRLRFAYPLKSLLELKGKDLIGGSDSPVESLSPVRGICSAMKNPVEGESLSLREALNLYSVNAAGKSPLTRDTGVLAKGMKCSLVVFDCTSPEGICSANVSAVLIDGKIEFRRSGIHGK